MRAYILESSARPRGYSAQAASLAGEELAKAGWEVKGKRAFEMKAAYCLACEKCRDESVDCVQYDDMQGCYQDIIEADALVFVTPIEFSSVPAQLKTILDRCQRFYNRPYRREEKIPSYFIAFAGQKPYKEQFEIYPLQFKHLLRNISSYDAGHLNLPGTDAYGSAIPAGDAAKIASFARQIASRA
jgi:multimeric flavodoxin WrbA